MYAFAVNCVFELVMADAVMVLVNNGARVLFFYLFTLFHRDYRTDRESVMLIPVLSLINCRYVIL